MSGPDPVLAFWFGDSAPGVAPDPHPARWFGGDPVLDRMIAERFAGLIEQAGSGRLDHWAASPRGRLALILLLDQFPRNAFRGDPRAYAFDRKALALCREGLRVRADRPLRPVERLFFYLPLLHAEDRTAQLRSVACFARLAAEGGPQRAFLRPWARIAWRQLLVVWWFGRHPHRNALLGRPSRWDERAFLRRGTGST